MRMKNKNKRMTKISLMVKMIFKMSMLRMQKMRMRLIARWR
jgi:hypothetical protein